MPHIVIATDFSDNAMHAAEYAVELFGQRGNTYTLLNAYYDISTADAMMPSMTRELLQAAEEGLGEFANRFVRKTAADGVQQEVLYGMLPGVVNEFAQEKGAQLVVMGNRGKTGTAIFGSNTLRMIRGSRIPVLAVPETAPIEAVKRILLADDYEDVLPRHLEMLRLIAILNRAEVMVAHVRTTVIEGPPTWSDRMYALSLHDIPHSFEEVQDEDVVHGLDRLARSRHVNMIAVLHRHIGMLGRMLHPSTARELTQQAELPLLVMQDTD